MGTYSSANIRAPKGSSRGNGRNYRGQYQSSYLHALLGRLAQKNSDIEYCQQKFDEAQAEGKSQNAELFAAMLDRKRKEAGWLEISVAKAQDEAKGGEVAR